MDGRYDRGFRDGAVRDGEIGDWLDGWGMGVAGVL